MTNRIKCPCGRVYDVVLRDERKVIKMKSQTSWNAAPQEPPAPAQRRNSAREWDVVVPLQIALISGALVALFMLAKGSGIGLSLQGGIVCTGVIWILVVLFFFGSRLDAVLWILEKRLDQDLDGDGEKGKPEPPPEKPGRMVISGNAGRRPQSWEYLTASEQVDDLVDFAKRAWQLERQERATGQKAFRGVVLPSRFAVNDSIHSRLVRDLVDAGIAYPRKAGGFVLGDYESTQALTQAVRSRVRAYD